MSYDIEQLRATQHAKGWADDQLASEAGVASSTVWRVLNGRCSRRPHPRTLKKIADALGVQPALAREAS